MGESLREQPVGEPRVPRSSGPCRQVPSARPNRQPSKPLSPSLPKPATTRPNGSAASSRYVRPAWFSKPAASSRSRFKLTLEQDVTDHPPLAGHRVQRKEADAGQLGSGPVAVELSEQLVAAADREQGGAPSTAALIVSPLAARSGAISACSRSCPPPM